MKNDNGTPVFIHQTLYDLLSSVMERKGWKGPAAAALATRTVNGAVLAMLEEYGRTSGLERDTDWSSDIRECQRAIDGFVRAV
jgi:hypothetical protein